MGPEVVPLPCLRRLLSVQPQGRRVLLLEGLWVAWRLGPERVPLVAVLLVVLREVQQAILAMAYLPGICPLAKALGKRWLAALVEP